MSFGDRFKSSLTESLMISGVAALGYVAGAEGIVESVMTYLPGMSSLSPNIQNGLVIFGLVFLSDMVYNLFLA